MTSPITGVSATVLRAFGLPALGQPLPGGEGRSYLHGKAVLKPVDNPAEAEWSAALLASIEQRGFRLPRPLQTQDGRWIVDGWSANQYVDGEVGPVGRWEELLSAGREFHAALACAPKPGFLDRRRHRWAHADRVAWVEQVADVPDEAAELLARLNRLLRPVNAPSQLIHGDLSGNVLFAEGDPPAIIDFSPYWRPAAYADAIVVVDGLLWFGAGQELVAAGAQGADFPQLFVRALIFRLIALTEQAREAGPDCLSELQLFTPVVNTVEQLIR